LPTEYKRALGELWERAQGQLGKEKSVTV
jgi:hypothetical protein